MTVMTIRLLGAAPGTHIFPSRRNADADHPPRILPVGSTPLPLKLCLLHAAPALQERPVKEALGLARRLVKPVRLC